MTERVQVGGLQVAKVLYDFVNNEAIPGTGVDAAAFWAGADSVIHDLAPKNRALLASEKAWREERAHLIEKNEMARLKVEAMISRLKALEQDS